VTDRNGIHPVDWRCFLLRMSGLTYNRIACELGVTGERVRQRLARVLRQALRALSAHRGAQRELEKVRRRNRELEAAMAAGGTSPPPPEPTIDDLVLSTRAYNCARRAGVFTVGDLARVGRRRMLAWQNCGRKTVAEIEEELAAQGMRLED